MRTRQRFLRDAGLGIMGVAAAGTLPSALRFAQTAQAASISGNLTAWDWSDSPDTYGVAQQTAFYSKYFPSLYSGLHFSSTIFGYTDLLPKLTIAWRGGGGPDVVRTAIAWSPQFVDEGLVAEISPSALGIPIGNFWPQALQTVRKSGSSSGPIYGVPSNNEAMLLIYNKDIFQAAGLNPNKGPATWEDLATYSNTIHKKTGKYGYGMVGVLNNGNTPFRFCPAMWAHGGSIFDELSPHPTFQKIGINSPGTAAALELYDRMYNKDKSVQPSALTDQESDVSTLFLSGKVAMIIDHPSAAEQVHKLAPHIRLGGDLIPAGPVRRAVVFGGSNLQIRAGSKNMDAAMAFLKAYLAPDWDTRLAGLGSNPGNRAGYQSTAQKQRNGMLLFNDVTLKMMQYGVNVPLVAQGAQIWNAVIPSMIQRVLTQQMSAKDSAAQAASDIQTIMKA